jgi:hypothetical protein
VRWLKTDEWSPWNCVLLTLEECSAHLKSDDIEKVGLAVGFRSGLLVLMASCFQELWGSVHAKGEAKAYGGQKLFFEIAGYLRAHSEKGSRRRSQFSSIDRHQNSLDTARTTIVRMPSSGDQFDFVHNINYLF